MHGPVLQSLIRVSFQWEPSRYLSDMRLTAVGALTFRTSCVGRGVTDKAVVVHDVW